MSNELTIKEAFDIKDLSTNVNEGQIRKIAIEKANFIAQRIHSLTEKLKEAERLSIDAKHTKSDLMPSIFGGESATDKRSKLNQKVNSLQNEAIAELANLVQASIRFATASALLNEAMLKAIADISNEGFIDVYGNVQQIKDKHEIEYIKQIEYGLKANEQTQKQGEYVAKNAESISKNYQKIRQLNILVWVAIVLSLVSLGISLAGKF